LDEETRNKVKELKQKISALEIDFCKNVNEENTKLAFKKEDLDGITDDLLNSLEKVRKD
jgi:Zn-dependent oligopeptidase